MRIRIFSVQKLLILLLNGVVLYDMEKYLILGIIKVRGTCKVLLAVIDSAESRTISNGNRSRSNLFHDGQRLLFRVQSA